jgi:signal transduction histidine kinase
MERSDRESRLEAWLEENGVADPWELVGPLAVVDLDEAALASLAAAFSDHLADVVRLLSATREAEDLLAEIGEGATRISHIVKTLKSWSYLDQAPFQDVDLHEGIENTLMILRGKLKGLEVRREFAADLPKLRAYGAELNQVWTNLVDNAADALDGKGTITIRTKAEDGWITVEVEDDGPGIPPEIQPRIFDAFFTTKAPGKGTGLGLDISWRIVVDRHRGDLKVFSRPGQTRFEVRLPIDPARKV